jgi:hypothetical protein
MPTFIPGLELAEAFYQEAVQPILDAEFPDLAHAAALIGSGSEVLGLDDAMSTDHHWGPRAMLFLHDQDHRRHAVAIRRAMSEKLPVSFRGYPTNYSEPGEDGSQLLEPVDTGPVNHRIEVLTIREFLAGYLAWDVDREITPSDWLTFPSPKLRSITEGAVFHDAIGLRSIRERLRFYPHDVWLYLLAAGWRRISQEEHFVGRAGLVGDDLGSRIIAARLVRDVMHLGFLMEREYSPYSKWLGLAFSKLRCAEGLRPVLKAALRAETWEERNESLCSAYRMIAEMHNALSITEALPTEPTPFWGRPFRVIHAERFSKVICDAIRDPDVRRIAERPPIGSIDQFSDSTDLVHPFLRAALLGLYG